jgi:predicted transcriptional regulator
MPHLSLILEKAKKYNMVDKESGRKLLESISGNPIKVNAAINGLLSAMQTIEAGHKVMQELRVQVGKVIMNFVSEAYSRQRQNMSSSRVIGSLLMEALEWDKDVAVPKDLPKMYAKMAAEFTQGAE